MELIYHTGLIVTPYKETHHQMAFVYRSILYWTKWDPKLVRFLGYKAIGCFNSWISFMISANTQAEKITFRKRAVHNDKVLELSGLRLKISIVSRIKILNTKLK